MTNHCNSRLRRRNPGPATHLASGRWVALTSIAVVSAVSCQSLQPRPVPGTGSLAEPEVFEIIRASNSKAAIDFLSDRYQEELEHAQLLEENIAQLIAAEEGLAMQLRQESAKVSDLRKELETLNQDRTDVQRDLQKAKEAQATRTDELAAAQQAVTKIEADLASLTDRQQKLAVAVESARAKLEQAPSEDAELQALHEQLRQLIEQIEAKLAETPTDAVGSNAETIQIPETTPDDGTTQGS